MRVAIQCISPRFTLSASRSSAEKAKSMDLPLWRAMCMARLAGIADTRMRPLALILVAWAAALHASAAAYSEDFSASPQTRGWRTFGNSDLLQWNRASQNLQVTWDSSQPNSYFYLSIGTVLAKSDDF